MIKRIIRKRKKKNKIDLWFEKALKEIEELVSVKNEPPEFLDEGNVCRGKSL